MDFVFIDIGLGNFVLANRIVNIADAHSAPVRRIIHGAREQGKMVDVTYGRKKRSAIITDSGHIFLSFLQQKTISRRLGKG